MKKKRIKGIGLLFALAPLLCSHGVFAADYSMNYSGGEALGSSNVNINPGLVNSLAPLFQNKKVDYLTTSESTKWKSGYILDNLIDSSRKDCVEFKYFTIDSNNLIGADENLSLTMSNNKYSVDVSFDDVQLVNNGTQAASNKPLTIGVAPGWSYIYGGWNVYSDAKCTEAKTDSERLERKNDERLFVKMNLKLHRKGQKSIYSTNGMFFGLTDIDAAQSYKILNHGNELTRENMFAKDASKLQPSQYVSGLRNMFVSEGNYIYSQYTIENDFALSGGNDIFVKLTQATQQEGLNAVFGFAEAAASGVEYYNRILNVTYTSDDNGKITGIKDEKVPIEDNPAGSKQVPNEDYEFKYWIADKDVVLTDGTTIKAGEQLTDEQIIKVVVTEDIEFKAIHAPIPEEPAPAAPNTGASTEELNASQIAISVIGITLGALMIGLLPRLYHKKLGFKK